MEESHADKGDIQEKLLSPTSRRLTTAHMKQIADRVFYFPAHAQEMNSLREVPESHDIHTVQVLVEEAQTITLKFSLIDEGGVFLESMTSIRPVRYWTWKCSW